MYERFYQLRDRPFALSPDPRFFFSSRGHRRAVAYLDNASGILNVWSQPIDRGAPKQLTNFKSEFLSNFAVSHDGKIAAYRVSATRDIVLIKGFR